jgi:hypothetical protein
MGSYANLQLLDLLVTVSKVCLVYLKANQLIVVILQWIMDLIAGKIEICQKEIIFIRKKACI